MRVGGRVEWLLEPRDPDELKAAYQCAREEGFVPRILGGGANLIVEDGLHPGVVIATARLRRTFRPDLDRAAQDFLQPPEPDADPDAQPENAPRLVTWCGASMPGVVRTAGELGWSGLEGLVGVPGHMGGGVAMNAGGRWGELWDVIEMVRVIDEEGEFRDLERADCTPAYRNANLDGKLVVGCVLKLERADKPSVRERMRQYLFEKKAAQPVTEWSAGCVFKNPDRERSAGRSAGQLVEDCGGKSLQRGDAIVSPLHGNFIVNTKGATATDVLTLIEDLRDLVAQKTGILLEREVKCWLLTD